MATRLPGELLRLQCACNKLASLPTGPDVERRFSPYLSGVLVSLAVFHKIMEVSAALQLSSSLP